jgi:hypothetical protein
MAQIPERPLLRLDDPVRETRQSGGARFVKVRKFKPNQQSAGQVGRRFSRLGDVLDQNRDPLELRADPEGLAPERLLVFELTGDVAFCASGGARSRIGIYRDRRSRRGRR